MLERRKTRLSRVQLSCHNPEKNFTIKDYMEETFLIIKMSKIIKMTKMTKMTEMT